MTLTQKIKNYILNDCKMDSVGIAPASAFTDEPAWHAHALFTYLEGDAHRIASGHLKSATVLYTAEIEVRPVIGGVIGTAPDAETGTRFWHFA